MKICYVDESGDLCGLPQVPTDQNQPVFVITAVIFDDSVLRNVVNEFLILKKEFYPGLPYRSAQFLDSILAEVKGSEVRKQLVRSPSRSRTRHAIGFMDRVFGILETNSAVIFSRIYVKALNSTMKHQSVYSAAMQGLLQNFERYLETTDNVGICIADSREFKLNVNSSHSIFTRKYSAGSTNYARIQEVPVFGHSDNHAGLQICDLVTSAIMYPIACWTYCAGTVANIHVQAKAANLRAIFGPRIRNLQYRYQDLPGGRYRGGIVVSDLIGHRNGSFMLH